MFTSIFKNRHSKEQQASTSKSIPASKPPDSQTTIFDPIALAAICTSLQLNEKEAEEKEEDFILIEKKITCLKK